MDLNALFSHYDISSDLRSTANQVLTEPQAENDAETFFNWLHEQGLLTKTRFEQLLQQADNLLSTGSDAFFLAQQFVETLQALVEGSSLALEDVATIWESVLTNSNHLCHEHQRALETLAENQCLDKKHVGPIMRSNEPQLLYDLLEHLGLDIATASSTLSEWLNTYEAPVINAASVIASQWDPHTREWATDKLGAMAPLMQMLDNLIMMSAFNARAIPFSHREDKCIDSLTPEIVERLVDFAKQKSNNLFFNELNVLGELPQAQPGEPTPLKDYIIEATAEALNQLNSPPAATLANIKSKLSQVGFKEQVKRKALSRYMNQYGINFIDYTHLNESFNTALTEIQDDDWQAITKEEAEQKPSFGELQRFHTKPDSAGPHTTDETLYQADVKLV